MKSGRVGTAKDDSSEAFSKETLSWVFSVCSDKELSARFGRNYLPARAKSKQEPEELPTIPRVRELFLWLTSAAAVPTATAVGLRSSWTSL